jgi:hypothetical protein
MNDKGDKKTEISQVTKDNRIDYFKEIADFARSEITFVRSAYKWLISMVALVAAVGISVGIWFTYNKISDFQKDMREEVERLKTEVSRRIDEEFKRENIHKMVEKKASEHIDAIADRLIEEKINNKVSPQIKLAQEQLEKVQSNFKLAENNIRELKQRNEITRLGDKGLWKAAGILSKGLKKW